MEDSPLGSLAAELRNMIWELVVTHNGNMFIAPSLCKGSPEPQSVTTNNKHVTAVLSVCKQMRSECSALFYSLNAFEVRTSHHNWQTIPAVVTNFSNSIGQENAQMIRNMCFSITLDEQPRRDLIFDSPYWSDQFERDLSQVLCSIGKFNKREGMESLRADFKFQSRPFRQVISRYTFRLDFLDVEDSFRLAAFRGSCVWPKLRCHEAQGFRDISSATLSLLAFAVTPAW
ncbi:hypothetical protein CKM354_000682700 [Cercospora kikuchii]|uniref:2EXR domain-containing protein n=1 Tax=Cercospora kikuchii TaxID=84275 RepID=A0A9P3FDS7_9PEZI|nr:uncharacterized protein CKM354_000682700 [Cercospora kikuchii]GIZ43608.1 hypothetical protein CKM354_000682700 [Cercospora kikuchii]